MSTVFSMDNLNITLNGLFTGPYRFLLLLLSIILVVVLTMLPAKYFFTKHILWLIWTALLGTFIYPIYKQNSGLFYNSALTTTAIVTLLSILAFIKPELISDNWNFTLFILLAGLFISQVIEMILKSKGIISQFHYIPLYRFLRLSKKYGNKFNLKDFSNSEYYFKNSFSLPIYVNLPLNKQTYIIKTLKNYILKNVKRNFQ